MLDLERLARKFDRVILILFGRGFDADGNARVVAWAELCAAQTDFLNPKRRQVIEGLQALAQFIKFETGLLILS